MNVMTKTEINAIADADRLGVLLAQIAELQKEAEGIKDSIKNAASAGGSKVIEGSLFKATYVESNRKTVDYKRLLADLGVSDNVVENYTSVTAVFSVKVTSK